MTSWTERDLAVNWHPYTQMEECREVPPLVIERAEGVRLFDERGRAYWDTVSSWWCNIHGHNHPRIREAIDRQLRQLDHVLFAGFTHRPAITLAERLIAMTPPPLQRAFFTDNGSTAVESALKMSLQYWRNIGQPEKQHFACFDRGYHGDTLGAMSVAGLSVFNQAFTPLMFESRRIAAPDCYRCPCRGQCDDRCLDPLETLLREEHDRLAGVIMEPLLLAAGGMIVYPARYLEQAARLARQYDVHLILDEVATGFGRTGTMFACEQAGVCPDFLCLSKGITGGTLPLAATLTTATVYEAFLGPYDAYRTFYHGHTFTANPVGCAAALACLDIFQEEKTLERARPRMERLQQEARHFGDLPAVGDVRGIGMVAAFELVSDKPGRKPLANVRAVGLDIYRRGLEAGLILRPLGPVCYLYLPLATRDADLDAILERTYRVLRDVTPAL
jgi:adenosylmethionine-8-amino-7-oxononanoate aminotransferase